jgi:hypothetical protein
MSDYSNTFGGAAKDAANDTILGADFDTQFDSLATHVATKANKVGAATSGNLASLSGTGDLQDSNLKSSKTPQVDSTVTFEKDVVWDAVNDEGSGGSVTIDWTLGNKAKYTMSSNGTLTFTAPGGPTNLMLKITNSGGARTITWPATVKWPEGSVPTPSTGVDLYSFFYDGTNYYGAASLSMS